MSQKISIRQQLLQAINSDPKTVSEIAEETGIERKKVGDNIAHLVIEGLATRQKDDDGVVYHITAKGKTRLGDPSSATSETGMEETVPQLAGRASANKPVHSAHIDELKRTISVRELEIERLNRIIDDHPQNAAKTEAWTSNKPRDLSPAEMIAMLQSHLTNGISLHIHENSLALVCGADWKEFRIESHEFSMFMNALVMLEERRAA